MPRVRAPALAVALSLVGLAAGGCGGSGAEEPRLAALKREPVATMTLPEGTLERETETEEHRVGSKPVSARVFRVFAFDRRDEAARGRDSVIETAVSSGWQVNLRRRFDSGPFFGAKALTTGEATLTVGEFVDGGRYKVSIKVEHTTCPSELCGAG